jgi:hypothetical protein
MKNFFLRQWMHFQLRSIARHLNSLDEQTQTLENTKRWYERRARRISAELLATHLKTRQWRA